MIRAVGIITGSSEASPAPSTIAPSRWENGWGKGYKCKLVLTHVNSGCQEYVF